MLSSQLEQVSRLANHAIRYSPFYRQRLLSSGYGANEPLNLTSFSALPITTRVELQDAADAAFCPVVPPSHGRFFSGKTTGSTGRPLHYRSTQFAKLHWDAITLREHLWHRRDFAAKLAIARGTAKTADHPDWGHPIAQVFRTGPGVALDASTDIAKQVEWLQMHQPAYFLTHPSNLLGIAEYCLQHDIRPPGLREVRTVGEIVSDTLRRRCREAFDVRLVDMYSACETGYLALQCPETNNYHVQSETVLLEVVDADNNPCKPGEMGRVIVTVLDNFAMPFIRYDIGDYAVAGAGCTCGRGLPVLERIVGRQRNLVVTPDGRRYWPRLGYKRWTELGVIDQAQFVQKDVHTIEAKLVVRRQFSADEHAQFLQFVADALEYPFRIEVSYHAELPRGPGGKFEEFISLTG